MRAATVELWFDLSRGHIIPATTQDVIPLLVRFTNLLTPYLVFTLRSIDYFASITTTIPPGVDLAANRGPNVI
jgi:hypothetical protein